MEFDQAVAQLATLVETLERENDERALLLLGLMDDIHRPGLELIVDGQPDHPIARALLAMYDLGPVDQFIEAEEALDEIRPYIESHGGGLELLGVDGGLVHVRLSGSCHGCAASAMTLRRGVESKLRERIPWFEEIVAHEPVDEPSAEGLLPLPMVQVDPGPWLPPDAGEPVQVAQLRRPVFVDVARLSDLPPGGMMHAAVDDQDILVLNVDGEPYAFHNVCPVDGRSTLDGGRLTGSVLVCPWHNCAYDARSGKRADDEPNQAPLAVVPVAVSSDGVLRVAANVA